MLCQKCGKNQANVFYKQMINGEYKEMSLCAECANELESPLNIFGNNKLNTNAQKVCDLCGSTLRDIARSGKAGCSKCYDTFRNELNNTIAHIHGKMNHVGRVPKGNKLYMLKAQLKNAVEKQEFETAAKLRDEIISYEQEGN